MKTHRFPFLVILLVLMSLLLSSCGGTLYHTWPGATAKGTTVYLSDANRLYAIDATSGKDAAPYFTNPDSGKSFFAAPAIAEDGSLAVGDYGHQLFLLDSNLKTKWQKPFDAGNGFFVASPLIVKNTILAPSSNNKLYAIDMNGNKLWEFESKNMLWATPASDGTTVYLPALDHFLYALNLADGKKVWEKDLGSALQSAPLLTSDGTLYLATFGGEVVAMKAQDGTIQWRKTMPAPAGHLWATPVLNKDVLFVGSDSGKIAAFSTKDGSVVWQQDAGSAVTGSPAVTTDAVVFATESGKLVAWSLDGQKNLWNPTVNGKLYSTPVIAGDTLVAPITEGKDNQVLQAFSLSGQTGWSYTPPK